MAIKDCCEAERLNNDECQATVQASTATQELGEACNALSQMKIWKRKKVKAQQRKFLGYGASGGGDHEFEVSTFDHGLGGSAYPYSVRILLVLCFI